MENNRDILRMELSEINTYVRQHFQQFLTWYSFFLTINYTVLGWFTSLLLTNALKTSKPIIFIALFFLVQILLSYLACRVVRKHFQDSYDRYNEILHVLADNSSSAESYPHPVLPIKTYNAIISLMIATFASFTFFWVAILALTIHLVPL